MTGKQTAVIDQYKWKGTVSNIVEDGKLVHFDFYRDEIEFTSTITMGPTGYIVGHRSTGN